MRMGNLLPIVDVLTKTGLETDAYAGSHSAGIRCGLIKAETDAYGGT